MRKTSYLLADVERENFKIDCRSLFGVGPADTMHVDYTQACCNGWRRREGVSPSPLGVGSGEGAVPPVGTIL